MGQLGRQAPLGAEPTCLSLPVPRSESAFRRGGSPFAAESASNARTMERLIPTNPKRRWRELSNVDPAPVCRWLRHNHWGWRSGQRSSRKSGRTGFPYASADPEAHRCGERRKFRQAQGRIQPTFLLQCKAGTDLWVLGIASRTRHSGFAAAMRSRWLSKTCSVAIQRCTGMGLQSQALSMAARIKSFDRVRVGAPSSRSTSQRRPLGITRTRTTTSPGRFTWVSPG